MNAKEAMAALLDGKKIRGELCSPTYFIWIDKDGDLVNNHGETCGFFEDRSYEIYQEPVRLVFRWLWCHLSDYRWCLIPYYYTDGEINKLRYTGPLIKLEWSKQEFSK